jgi:hypothetical protein
MNKGEPERFEAGDPSSVPEKVLLTPLARFTANPLSASKLTVPEPDKGPIWIGSTPVLISKVPPAFTMTDPEPREWKSSGSKMPASIVVPPE